MLIIGVTGSLGSGKTTIASFFARRGVKVVNADKLAHSLILPGKICFKRIIRVFGKDILVRGRIDRKKLGECVFSDTRNIKKLNAIIHPQVIKAVKKKMATYRKTKAVKAVILDVPLLIESGMHKLCDVVIIVKSSLKAQTARLKSRGFAPKEIQKRLSVQMSFAQKRRHGDFIIDNTKNFQKTKKQVEDIWQKLQQ